MFTSKSNSITHDLSDELVFKLSQDFTMYVNHYVKQRSLLIKQNITYKQQTLHSSSLSSLTKKITIRLIPRLHPSSLIVLSKQTVIPQSFFCFPIIDSIMRSNSFTLNFIDHFDTYNSFLKAKNAMERIPTLFTQYPSHDVMLKINNDSFWLWFFITTITQFTSLYNINFTNDNNDNIYTLCLFISNLLTKKVTAFYSLLSKYISNIKHTIKLKHSRTQLSRFSTYRKAYCQICKRFYCNVHFYDKASVDVYNNMKVVSHFQMKTSENRNAIIKNISPYLQDKGEMYLNEYACDYDNRNDCCKVNKITVTASSHEDELIRQMNMNDFYLLNVLLTTTLFDNACFICMLFNYKYKCNYIDALLSFITLDRKRMKIDKYFITAYPPLQSLLSEKLTVIFNDNRTTTMNSAYTSNNTNNTHNNEYYNDLYNQKNFEPCSHAGLCKKDICKCFIRGHCEEYCLCYKNCELKFQGCNCIGNCRFNGENSINSTCPCIQKGRECQIGMCRSCISCSNMSIQLRKYKKVILGQSLIIPSNGLFAYENIKANDLIGVYLGEIVERTELDRRSVFSDELEKHYSFSQDDNFDIDALRCGNAMRYINHSKYGYENCFAKNVFTQGRIIVALYAKRDIMKGEELYFDYRMKSVHWINIYMNNVDDEESSNESENYFNLSNVKTKQEETHLQKKRRKGKNITNGNVNSSNNNNNNSHKRSKQICQFYINGACNKGDKCKYSHECEQIHKKELCKFYLSNTCTKGDKCLYSHNLKDYPCKFYHARGFCENCENCRFSHARLNEHELMEFIKQNEDFLMETKKKYGQTNMDEFFDEYLKNKMEVINGQEIKMIPNELKDLPSYNNTSANNVSNVNGKGNVPLGVLLIASNPKIMMEVMKSNMVNNNDNNNSKICGENVKVCNNKKEVPLLVNPFISPSQINDDYIQQFINSSTSGKNK